MPAFVVRSPLSLELNQKQKTLALSAFAASTRSTYGTGLFKYHCFCDSIQLPEINRAPCTTTIIAGFITYLSGHYSRTSINNFIAGVKAWHVVNLIPYDVDDKTISILLRGAERIQPLPLPKRQPLSLEQLCQIIEQLNLNNCEQAAFAACITTTFFSCARLGEFTVPSLNAFNPQVHITVSGISFHHDRFFNHVTAFKIPRTKTTTTGELVFWAAQKSPCCPAAMLHNHLKLNEPSAQNHLFSFKTHNKRIPMTRSIFMRNLKTASIKANIPLHSGHSLRIGATLEYLLRGVPFDVVKQIGRWSSNSFSLYLREHGRILAPYLQSKPEVNSQFIEYTNVLLR